MEQSNPGTRAGADVASYNPLVLGGVLGSSLDGLGAHVTPKVPKVAYNNFLGQGHRTPPTPSASLKVTAGRALPPNSRFVTSTRRSE